MYDWETRLTSVDNNRVVRPLDWGVEWARDWPCRNGYAPGNVPEDGETLLREYNRRIVATSDEFFSYPNLRIFVWNSGKCRFSARERCPIRSWKKKFAARMRIFCASLRPCIRHYPENNLVNARWFPARGKRAVVLLPHWNSDALAYNALCRVFNLLGISVLRLSMPYHDIRTPAEIQRADYAVSANIGRTLDACRQAVIDVRCCLDWLESRATPAGNHGHEPGLLLCILGRCSRFAHSGGGIQSRLYLRCRCCLAWPIHAPHSPRPRTEDRFGTAARAVERQ